MPGGIEYTLSDPHSDFIFRSDDVMEWLRWLRQLHNLSQRDLEAVVDISHSEIHKIEAGKQECRLSSFTAICAELGVPPGLVLDLMVSSNIGLFSRSVENDPEMDVVLGQLSATGSLFRKPLGRQLAASCTLGAILVRCSAPVRRALVAPYPTDDLRVRFLRFARRLQTELAPAEKFTIIQNLRNHPCAELHRIGLLSDVSLQMQRDSLSLPPERRQQDFGWAPWVVTFEDAKRMWNIETIGPEAGKNKMLTEVTLERKTEGMTEMQELISRIACATRPPGKKTELAKAIGVTSPRVSEWLRKEHPVVPSGETTLRLLHWIGQQERQQNTIGSDISTANGKTRVRSSTVYEKAKSSPPKR